MNPTEPNVPAIRQRRPMTEARLKANRENAKKAALSALLASEDIDRLSCSASLSSVAFTSRIRGLTDRELAALTNGGA